MKQEELDALLTRWKGKPGTTKGLSHEESIAMVQAVIDNGQVYTDISLCAWAVAFSEPGWVTGFDSAKVPAEWKDQL